MLLVTPPPPFEFPTPEFFQQLSSPAVEELVRQTNDAYWPWDEFRRRPFPPGLSEEVSRENIWNYVQIGRRVNARPVPLLDKVGRAFTYGMPDCVLRSLNELDRNSGKFIGSGQSGKLPDGDRYVVSSLMEEAIASSQLEGAATTRRVAKEMLRTGRKPRDPSELMIVNNWRTMQYLRENHSDPLTVQEICNIHSMISKGTLKDGADEGRIRTHDEVVVVYREEEVHVPPAAISLPDRLQALCDFAASNDEKRWIHPILKAIILHFWLGYDHPFVDGNGRTARALFYRYLLSEGYWLYEYVAISRGFLKAPAKYARAYAYSETDNNDLTYFLVYNLQVIERVLDEFRQYLAKKQNEMASLNAQWKSYPGLNDRQRALLVHAAQHPESEYTIESHRASHDVSYQTARTDLLKLADQGLLRTLQRGKALVFVGKNNMASDQVHLF
jgi:Fic family protein